MDQVTERDGNCPACGQPQWTSFGIVKDWKGQVQRRVPVSTQCDRGCTFSEIEAAKAKP